MPGPEQEALFERLEKKFGNSPQWERLTRPYDFCTMSRHKAFHYLQMLLWQLAGKAVPSRCSCFTSAHGISRPERNEHLPVAGARNRAAV
jgi:hypothetical protein